MSKAMIDCVPFSGEFSASVDAASLKDNLTFVSSLFAAELFVEAHFPLCDRFLKAPRLSINDL